MSAHRAPWERIAGAFATLVAMIPWKLLHASGWEEDMAALAAGVVLFVLALVALLLRRTPIAERRYVLVGSPFEVRRFLMEFACYAFALIVLLGGGWLYYAHGGTAE